MRTLKYNLADVLSSYKAKYIPNADTIVLGGLFAELVMEELGVDSMENVSILGMRPRLDSSCPAFRMEIEVAA